MCSKVAWWASCRWCPLRLTGLVSGSVATERVKPYALCGQTALGTVTALRPGGPQQTSDCNSITDILLSPGYCLPSRHLTSSVPLPHTDNSGQFWLVVAAGRLHGHSPCHPVAAFPFSQSCCRPHPHSHHWKARLYGQSWEHPANPDEGQVTQARSRLRAPRGRPGTSFLRSCGWSCLSFVPSRAARGGAVVPQRGSRVHRLPRASSSSPEIPRQPWNPRTTPLTHLFLPESVPGGGFPLPAAEGLLVRTTPTSQRGQGETPTVRSPQTWGFWPPCGRQLQPN